MIAAVYGEVEAKTLDSALIRVGGVTLRVLAPLSTLSRLPVGDSVRLHTYLLVREDALTLYGFDELDDRAVFEQMLTVGGVGPRIGLALLSGMNAQTIREAVLTEDLTRLTMAPGVGRKLAARIVLELRPVFEKQGFATVGAGVASGGPTGNVRAQVIDALTTLGYPAAQAAAAVRTLPEDASGPVEDLILQALRSLARD